MLVSDDFENLEGLRVKLVNFENASNTWKCLSATSLPDNISYQNLNSPFVSPELAT